MLAFMVLSATASGASWTVGSTGDFTTLADAVAAASSGDSLSLAAGSYDGCVDLAGKSLSLVGVGGSGAVVIDGLGLCEDALSALTGEALVIQGIALRNSGGRGLRLGGGATLSASDLVISDSGADDLNGGGLYVDGGSVTLTDSHLSGNRASSGGNVFLTGGARFEQRGGELALGVATTGGGLYAEHDGEGVSVILDGVSVSGNSATGAGAGLFLDREASLDSEGSTFDANVGVSTHGVAIYTRADVRISSQDDTFTNNAASDLASGYSGGAIYLGARGALTLSGGSFEGNTAYEGGAIFQQTGGALSISDTLFTGNSSYENGGAIHASDDVALTLSLVRFEDNDSDYGSGGAIQLHDVGELVATDVDFVGNSAAEGGGAIYLDYAVNASFTGVSFEQNRSGGEGGALRHGFYGALTVLESSFDQNQARDEGGAVYLDYLAAESVFQGVGFTDNVSERGDGGALYAEDYGDLSLEQVTVTGNTALYDGGGVFASLWGDVTVTDARIEDNLNSLGNGGGLYIAPGTASAFDTSVSASTISGNSAGRHGGGLYSYTTRNLSLDEVVFTYNAADGDGPGIYHGGGAYLYQTKTARVTRSMFCANTATNGAGVFVSQLPSGTNLWTNNRFIENVASGLGGGAYLGNSKGQSFENNAVLGNQATSGGGVYARGSTLSAVNNVVAWTVSGSGFYAGDTATASGSTLTYGDWYSNSSAEVGGSFSLTLGTSGNIGVDPGFVDYSQDGDCSNDRLWLDEGSALVDAGEAGRLDPDGSTSDLGPYGGGGALAPDEDGDGVGTADWGGEDCDDGDATVYPGADERCDDQDDDCDGEIDEDAVDVGTWFTDEDGDTYGAPDPVVGCDEPARTATNGDDCDDADASVNPGAGEVLADGLDQDCDGLDERAMANLAYGDLTLSEIMADPTGVDDAVGEWFEVYNNTDALVDLDGLRLSDDDIDSVTVSGPVRVLPGDTALFAVRSDPSKNGGLPTPDYVWVRTGFRFDNVTDEINLSYGGLVFDSVKFGSGRELRVTPGAALQLDVDRLDPDLDDRSYAWCAATASYGVGGLGTPGGANQSCGVTALTPLDLTAGELFVTEVMVNPALVEDYRGEWFELYNNSGALIDLDGLVLADDGVDVLTVTGALLVEAEELVVLAAKESPGLNGGNTAVDYAYVRTTLRFDDLADELVLKNSAGVTLDRVVWTDLWGVSSGASISLDPTLWSATANDLAASWCDSESAYGLGDLGTPGLPNDACAADGDGDGVAFDEDCDDEDAAVYPGAPEVEGDGLDQDCDGYDQLGLDLLAYGDLVLSEVMANPAAADDAVAEWFEVYNGTASVVNLDGLVLSDLGSDLTTVRGTVAVDPGDFALLAVRSDAAVNGGLPTVDYVWLRTPFRFDNTSDEIVLSYDGLEFDRLAWGSSSGLSAPSGASLTVDATALDADLNDDPGAWCAGTAAYGRGDLGTPGAVNGACP